MARIGFVACSKTKAAQPRPAAALYTSPLFRKSLLAALTLCQRSFVLSAKHGVVDLGELLAPYDTALKTMPQAERRVWAASTGKQLSKHLRAGDVASFFAGEEYIQPLRNQVRELGCKLEEPLSGLSLGLRLQRLQAWNNERILMANHKAFYRIMQKLWVAQQGGRRLADSSGKQEWPRRGVYFLLDQPAAMPVSRMPRVARVGTHAVSLGARTTLWNRVSTHRGTVAGGGSHRSSIFRLHVGRALINAQPGNHWPLSWSKGQTASEAIRQAELYLEQEVSRTIGEMKLLWLNVPDDAGPSSDRAYIERHSIGLLSRAAALSPTMVPSAWLGIATGDWRIALSGLWNLDYLFSVPDDGFLSVLETYVDVTMGKLPEPTAPLAPKTWRSQLPRESDQLSLFG